MHHLDENKGPSYPNTLNVNPTEDNICGAEFAMTKFAKNMAEEIRQEISTILKSPRPARKNLSK